jgi:Leucine-rich repeat (LRR) protein
MHIEPLEPRLQCSAAPLAPAAPDAAHATVHRAHAAAAAAGVRFADPAVESIVRLELDLPASRAITPTDLLGLTTFAANAFLKDVPVIRSLKGLEHAKNLRVLEISGHLVSSLAPIAGLTRLRSLDVQSNRIRDLSPVGHLRLIRSLSISRNPIETGIRELRNLTELTRFDANGTGLVSLNFLRDLDKLTHVEADDNKIADISGLRGKHDLLLLFLYDNRVSDLSPLQGLRSLDTLDLSHNRIQDTRPLLYTGHPRMRIILAGNGLDLSPRSRASRVIARLRASGTKVVLSDA